jgi:hypothetical protein
MILRRWQVPVAVAGLFWAGCSSKPQGPPPSAPATSHSASTPREAVVDPEGFRPLSLDDFEVFQGKGHPPTPTWSSNGPMIHCSGKPRGYLYSKSAFRNFALRCDLRFPTATPENSAKANTGFFVYITPPHHVWPVCLEVQGKHSELGMIKGNGKPNPLDPANAHDDDAARQRARKAPAEWNGLEIVSRDGRVESRLNGVPISHNDPCDLRSGPIGLQAEDYPYDVRNLRIRDDALKP